MSESSARGSTAAAPRIIVDDVLFAKQKAVYASLASARRRQWAARISIRVCFLLLARALGYLSPWIATWPEGWNDVGALLLTSTQVLCVIFGFWTWTDRIFAKQFHETARRAYEIKLRKLGYDSAAPEFIVDLMRLQMRLDENQVKDRAAGPPGVESGAAAGAPAGPAAGEVRGSGAAPASTGSTVS